MRPAMLRSFILFLIVRARYNSSFLAPFCTLLSHPHKFIAPGNFVQSTGSEHTRAGPVALKPLLATHIFSHRAGFVKLFLFTLLTPKTRLASPCLSHHHYPCPKHPLRAGLRCVEQLS